VLAAGLALAALFPHRLPAAFDPGRSRLMDPLATGLRGVHDGFVNDYLTFLIAGAAVLGGAAAALLA